ncbi:MAG: hypothetical protein ACOCUH_02495, partial [Bacteriovoracia bacterium]
MNKVLSNTVVLVFLLCFANTSFAEPNYPTPLVVKIYKLYKKGDYVRTIKELDRLIELVPNWRTAYYWRGRAYQKLQQFEKAI